MKNRIIIVCAVVFSAIGIGFSSNLQKAEISDLADYGAKCAIPSFEEAFKNSKSVFVGKVISAEKNGDVRTFKFRSEKFWKGSRAKSIEIEVYETTRFQAWFEVGEKYLIFANDSDGKLSVGRCSRSNEISGAKDDLKSLGKGKKSK